jgi:hypothetical protein
VRGRGCGCGLQRLWAQTKTGQKRGRREREKGKKGFLILKRNKQMISNTNLNSNTQKQCTSMYATLNSYD